MKLSLFARIGTCVTLVALQISPAEAALTISGKATSHVTCASGVCTASAKNATLNVSDLTNLLATQNVTIRSGKKAVDIDVAAPFSWASKSSLKLDATGALNVEGTVSDAGKASLTIVTGDGGSGALSFGPSGNIAFMGTANSVTINGTPFTLVGNIAALAAAVSENPAGNYALAKRYNASHDGTYTSAPVPTLNGTFEGLGNAISGLAIADTAGSDLVGLFASIDGSAGTGAVRDLHLENVAISGGDTAAVGAVTGYLQQGSANNIWVSGHVQAGNGVAVGGMFGDVFDGSVTGMFSSAAVTIGSAQANGGGVAGYNDGTMLLSSASGAVTGGTAAIVGGLVGSNQGSITSSYATGKVAANGGGSNLGGLVGLTSGPISTSYATGAVKNGGDGSNASNVGGLLGYSQAAVSLAYASGHVSGNKGDAIGGVIGDDNGAGFTDAYWDTTTTGIGKASQGAGNVKNEPGIAGLSNAQLTSGLPAGFDPATWAEHSDINSGLPYLIDLSPPG